MDYISFDKDIDISKENQVQQILSETSMFLPDDAQKDILEAYTLEKPLSQIEIDTIENDETEISQFISCLETYFYTDFQQDSERYSYLYISRFDSVIQLVESIDLQESGWEGLRGILFGYPIKDVAAFSNDFQ